MPKGTINKEYTLKYYDGECAELIENALISYAIHAKGLTMDQKVLLFGYARMIEKRGE